MSFSKDYLDNTFEYLSQLHKSAKSEVILALNKNNNQLYVIKHIKNINLPYKEIKEIIHPLLPQIEYVYEDAEQTIVVEEYINGRNLAEYLAEKESLPEQDIIYLALAVCNVLKILHGKNIIHRDIKPANFLITSDGRIKLIDFDAARIVKDHKKQDTKYLGTEGYAPPEQYGFSQTDCRSDIYALGITIKDLVGKNYKGKLSKIIDKCTKVNPDQRFQSAEELARSFKKTQKPSYIKYIMAFVCLIAFILGGWYFYMHKSQPNLKENTSEVQTDISDIKIDEQPDSKVITEGTEQKEQTEVEKRKSEKSSNKSANVKNTAQNTTTTTPQPEPTEKKQSQQIQKIPPKIQAQKSEISRHKIDAYYHLTDMDVLRFNNSYHNAVCPHDSHNVLTKTTGKVANDFPGSQYITAFKYLNLDITNNSEEDMVNTWVSIYFDERYTVIPFGIPNHVSPEKVFYDYDIRSDKSASTFIPKLKEHKLYNSVRWNIGRLRPDDPIFLSIPLEGSLLLKEDGTLTIFISINSSNSEEVFTNYYVKFK